MFVRMLCGENSTRQTAGLKSGRLELGLKAGRGSAEGRKPLGRGSGGVPQPKFPFSRAREKGIKGMRAVAGSRVWLSTHFLGLMRVRLQNWSP